MTLHWKEFIKEKNLEIASSEQFILVTCLEQQ